MNTEPTIITPDGSLDLGNQLPDISSIINDIFGPIFWASIILTILMVGLYIHSMLRRRKVERAIIDMQKILSEMNERDKSRSKPTVLAPSSKAYDTIAASGHPEDSSDNPTPG